VSSDTLTPARPVAARLARRLGTGDAVVIGLGSMIGAGVFAAVGPAGAALGVTGCVALALTLLATAVLTGAAMLTAGATTWAAALRHHAAREH
jgi:basic amino acid/polyamine antiporter, APA family